MGEWVGDFLYFGYAYLNVTLPKMKERDVEEVLLRLFPRKISLFEPSDADSIIPELIAFWQFLHRQYKQRHSQKILAFLHKIQPTFKATMTDPQNFGLAKSFMMAGRAAGFDMTTEAGVKAYQQHYNQQLQQTGNLPPGFPALSPPMGSPQAGQNPFAAFPIPQDVPPEFVALLSQKMGFGTVPGLEHLPTDPQQLAEAIARHLVDSGEVTLQDDAEEDGDDFLQQLQANMLQLAIQQHGLELSESAMNLLQQQTITETEPGTIVKDFQTLLEAMGDRGLPVSGKMHHLALKLLPDLNQQLSHPIRTALQRPQQKSYPNLHGLYLLLRATGMAEVVTVGKTTVLQRNPEVYAAWQTLSPTDKYFTLLEAWVIRATPELLGVERDPLKEGTRVIRTWAVGLSKGKTFQTYAEQTDLNYWPGLHNLALMEMFGWVEITSTKPEAGKGWRVKRVKPLPLGEAIVTLLLKAYDQQGYVWASEQDFSQPWGELQPYVQPYFPEWQRTLPAPKAGEHQTGTYIFKVSLGKIWRRLSISSEATLEILGQLIRESVDFDSDHLDMFSYKDPLGRNVEIYHPYCEGEVKYTDEVKVVDLPLKPGVEMTYLFDFGDNWEFKLLLEEIQPGQPKRNSNKVLERRGQSPEQYPDWDGE
uniref:Plasmid pRiA4b Orf3-like domain-containing protein n=1 Tax=Cyanothece sp. (strain PCC 7425 / ATCC 29141) TaxID=395961 RepID=B8HM70_CYAP4